MNLTDKQLNAIRDTLTAKLRSGSISLEDIRRISEEVREVLDLDVIFAATNVAYRYQLDHLITCTRESVETEAPEHLQLTEPELHAITAAYTDNPISDALIPELGDLGMKAHLHAAILHNGEYFGTVGFGHANEHEWTYAEYQVLEYLRMMFLFYIGFSRLATGAARDTRINQIAQTPNIQSCYRIDFAAGQCHAVKLAPFMKGLVSEWMPYGQLVNLYAEKFIDPSYSKRIRKTLNTANLQATLSADNRTLSLEMPRILEGQASWINCTVEALDFNTDGTPSSAAITVYDITEETRNDAMLARSRHVDRNNYAAITGINLDTEKYAVYVDNRPDASESRKMEGYGDYRTIMSYTADQVVDPAYAEQFRDLFSIEKMRELFDGGAHIITMDFPGYAGDIHFWVRLEAVPATTYDDGERRVVLYYSDITEEKQREFQMEETRRSLEAERKRADENELQLTVDPLTGAYNRMGYEKYIKALSDRDEPLGYLMIDVDRFKEINDAFGHEEGDEALVDVVKMLKLAFRTHDKIFRMGGDEFVMVLEGCKESAWESICHKLAGIHSNLKRSARRTEGVTLSVGLVISPQGFREDLPALADNALYITKRNGRAGLTQVDLDGNQVECWNDNSVAAAKHDRREGIGKWRYECAKDGSQPPCLYLDEAAHFLLGMPGSLSPEECYRQWTAALPEQHINMLGNIQDKAAAIGKAEASHTWQHPTLGEVRIRTHVKFRETKDFKEFTGYFAVFNDDAILTPDDNQFVIQAMNNACFSTYYIDVTSGDFTIMKGFDNAEQPAEKSIQARLTQLIERDVHPDFVEQALDFVDLNTLTDRLKKESFLEFEYLSLTDYGWCRSRFLPVKWDDMGNVTHVLLSSISIDSQKRQELDQAKRTEDSLRLQLRVGELMAKSSLLQAGIVHKRTGEMRIWMDGLFRENAYDISFPAAKHWGLTAVADEDRLRFERDFTLKHIVDTVEREGKCTMAYRMTEEAGGGRTVMHHYETLKSDPDKMLMAVEEITNLLPQGVGWMTQFEVLESMTESISIFDYETREIVYLNKAAREYVGMEPERLADMKCYDLYNEGKGRCSFCDQLIREDGGDSFFLKQMDGKGNDLFIHGCTTELNGKKYLVEEAVPVTAIYDSLERIESLRNQ